LILQAVDNYVDESGDESLPQYRVYHLDGAGRVGKTEWLDAAGDEAAIRAARRDNSSVQCELWQGRRLVTRLAPEAAIAPQHVSPNDIGTPATP
jgi:hypothetical protein